VENKLNATTQQFITAKLQAARTHSPLRQKQLQTQAAQMSRRIQEVKHRKYSAGMACANPGLQDRILLSFTRIENAHKVRKKRFRFFVMFGSPANF